MWNWPDGIFGQGQLVSTGVSLIHTMPWLETRKAGWDNRNFWRTVEIGLATGTEHRDLIHKHVATWKQREAKRRYTRVYIVQERPRDMISHQESVHGVESNMSMEPDHDTLEGSRPDDIENV